jgi:hypothetical protein
MEYLRPWALSGLGIKAGELGMALTTGDIGETVCESIK